MRQPRLAKARTTWVPTKPQPPKMVPQMTEFWEPEVKAITPGTHMAAPSDAIVLFDGKDLSQWVSTNDPAKPAQWTVGKGVFTVKKGTGNIQTKQAFQDYQLRERRCRL